MYFNYNYLFKNSFLVSSGKINQSYSFLYLRYQILVLSCSFYFKRAGILVNHFEIYKNSFGFFLFIHIYELDFIKKKNFKITKFLQVIKKTLEITATFYVPVFIDVVSIEPSSSNIQQIFIQKNVFKGSQDIIKLIFCSITQPCVQSLTTLFALVLEMNIKHQMVIDFITYCFDNCFNSELISNKKLIGYKLEFSGRWNGADIAQTLVISQGHLITSKANTYLITGVHECITPYGVGNVKLIINYKQLEL